MTLKCIHRRTDGRPRQAGRQTDTQTDRQTRELHGDGDDGITAVTRLAFMTDTAVKTGMGTVGSTAEAVT